MFKIGSITLLVVMLLAFNRRLVDQSGVSQKGYWAISCIGIAVFFMSLLKVHVSLSTYLTRLVKPMITLIFGGV